MATLVMIPAADQIEIDRDPQLNVGFGIVGCASNDDVKHGRRCPCRLSCTYEDVLSPLRLVPPVDQVFVFYGAGLEFMIALELPNAVKRHGELAQLLPPTELFSDRSYMISARKKMERIATMTNGTVLAYHDAI